MCQSIIRNVLKKCFLPHTGNQDPWAQRSVESVDQSLSNLLSKIQENPKKKPTRYHDIISTAKECRQREETNPGTLSLLNKYWEPYAPICLATCFFHRETIILPMNAALWLLTNAKHWKDDFILFESQVGMGITRGFAKGNPESSGAGAKRHISPKSFWNSPS